MEDVKQQFPLVPPTVTLWSMTKDLPSAAIECLHVNSGTAIDSAIAAAHLAEKFHEATS